MSPEMAKIVGAAVGAALEAGVMAFIAQTQAHGGKVDSGSLKAESLTMNLNFTISAVLGAAFEAIARHDHDGHSPALYAAVIRHWQDKQR